MKGHMILVSCLSHSQSLLLMLFCTNDSSHVLQEEIRGFHGAYTLDYNGCHLMIVSAIGILMCMMILHTDLVSNRSSDLKASLNSILWYIISLYIYSKC